MNSEEKDICPTCGFDRNRPRGLIFTKDFVGYVRVETARCEDCGRVRDYDRSGIIYRNFEGSDEYFEKVKEKLEAGGDSEHL